MDDARHREFTGVSNQIILENLRLLAEQGRRISIRVPLVPGITDTTANLEAMADFLRGMRGIRAIHLLPYHKIAAGKYGRLELANRLAELEPPPPERIEAARAHLAAQGFEVHVGG
jgi:pyruvate formate lyase activating enzyme